MKFSKFFSNIQETSWYRTFLNPVINELGANTTLLDIGTGSGKLIQILSQEKEITCTGVDTKTEMLKEAKNKLKDLNVDLIKIEPNNKYPFENESFNNITICNVLFHLEEEGIDFILKESQRLLKKNGKIIVLTPTGLGNILSISKKYFSFKNLSIYIWFFATKTRAKTWLKNSYLKEYSNNHNLNYTSQIVMNGFAQLEIIKE